MDLFSKKYEKVLNLIMAYYGTISTSLLAIANFLGNDTVFPRVRFSLQDACSTLVPWWTRHKFNSDIVCSGVSEAVVETDRLRLVHHCRTSTATSITAGSMAVAGLGSSLKRDNS